MGGEVLSRIFFLFFFVLAISGEGKGLLLENFVQGFHWGEWERVKEAPLFRVQVTSGTLQLKGSFRKGSREALLYLSKKSFLEGKLEATARVYFTASSPYPLRSGEGVAVPKREGERESSFPPLFLFGLGERSSGRFLLFALFPNAVGVRISTEASKVYRGGSKEILQELDGWVTLKLVYERAKERATFFVNGKSYSFEKIQLGSAQLLFGISSEEGGSGACAARIASLRLDGES